MRRTVKAAVLGVFTPLTGPAAVVAPQVSVPVRPDREQARAWAVQELTHREYHGPGLVTRVLRWLLHQLDQAPVVGRPFQALAVTVLLALLVTLAVVMWRRGALHPGHRAEGRGPVFASTELTAADHRALADRAAADGDWPAAVVERFRAVARALEERAVISPLPGRTADEVAREAGAWLPEVNAALMAGARLFDDVRYGGHPAGPDADAALRDLDARVRAARPGVDRVAAVTGPVPPS